MDPTLRRDLRRAARRIAAALAHRDELVLAALETGATLRQVAAAAQLSHTAIRKIRDRNSDGYATDALVQDTTHRASAPASWDNQTKA